MNHDAYSDDYIRTILDEVKTVAMVGASANAVRPSYFVLKYLLSKGYEVWPINPGHAGGEILGQRVYASLKDLPGTPDMVDIFRNSAAAGLVVDEILAEPMRPKAIWMQLTVRNDAAARKAEAAGIKVVMDRCPKIEYGRLSGEIGWAGVNSRTLSARRPTLKAGFQHRGLGGDRKIDPMD
ncbi:CoA-binding protein [Polymorphum gilvum]|uniref:CoA binding domain protein n=1 Tax=Polymorphum gilvum (strain LMG 25793 / CGMCC 1.9160 / SL003B-26A1) TaxID=991905 RepID=F2IWP3_POLGS|nr:CoA-binding protein [Polymorphum gilvum]ADZ70368.1 CoA binding domain protein [Polymorphum gilvum SL003B-26A1]